VVVEAQMHTDKDKRYTWLAYIATASKVDELFD
jgi:hypothetical protein